MISGKHLLSSLTVLLSVCAGPTSFAVQSQTGRSDVTQASTFDNTDWNGGLPLAITSRILAQGVPMMALENLLRFREVNMGKTFDQEVYTCPKADVGSVKYCDETVRSVTSGTVTMVPHDYAVIIDFTKSSLEQRFFLINFKTGSVQRFRATHGVNSGSLFAYKFSNINNSRQTSLGIFVTGGTYKSSSHGTVIRMYGLEGSNSRAYYRDIVMHGAFYASENFPTSRNPNTNRPYDRLGLSWGCPALSETDFKTVLAVLLNGALVYHYNPDLEQAAMSGDEVRGVDLTPPVVKIAPIPRTRPEGL